MSTRIMYIECKTGTLAGSARIGRVTFNRTGRSLRYRDQVFRRIVGGGATSSNHVDEATGAEYWISGCKRRGGDRLHGSAPVEIDEDVREEYWRDIRKVPEHATPNV
jgi:hypothetical protein